MNVSELVMQLLTDNAELVLGLLIVAGVIIFGVQMALKLTFKLTGALSECSVNLAIALFKRLFRMLRQAVQYRAFWESVQMWIAIFVSAIIWASTIGEHYYVLFLACTILLNAFVVSKFTDSFMPGIRHNRDWLYGAAGNFAVWIMLRGIGSFIFAHPEAF